MLLDSLAARLLRGSGFLSDLLKLTVIRTPAMHAVSTFEDRKHHSTRPQNCINRESITVLHVRSAPMHTRRTQGPLPCRRDTRQGAPHPCRNVCVRASQESYPDPPRREQYFPVVAISIRPRYVLRHSPVHGCQHASWLGFLRALHLVATQQEPTGTARSTSVDRHRKVIGGVGSQLHCFPIQSVRKMV